MSSVAYAPEEIFLTLSIAGVASYAFSPWIGLAVVIVLLTVVTSYRQNVHAYPSGGGDYEVATVNLGRRAGLTVASALLVDYTLTVAVSISVGRGQRRRAGARTSPSTRCSSRWSRSSCSPRSTCAGIRESGVAFAIPTYAFMLGIATMIVWGLTRHPAARRDRARAERGPAPGGRGRRAHRTRAGAARAALVHAGLCRAHRRGGDQQRRAGVPQAQVAQRGHHAADARRRSPSPCSWA